jgi:hypothetical protein
VLGLSEGVKVVDDSQVESSEEPAAEEPVEA